MTRPRIEYQARADLYQTYLRQAQSIGAEAPSNASDLGESEANKVVPARALNLQPI